MRIKAALIRSLLLLLVVPVPCRAQWLTQNIQLVPGWNAVFLEVQPEPRSCNAVFRNQPVQSVWKWDRRFSTVQFTVDPASLVPESPDWLMWLPPANSRAFLNRLFELQGCQAYLIKVAPNAAPFTLAVKGRVIMPYLDWYPHGLNLVGFPVNPKNPPTFSEFFKFTPEIETSLGYANELYRLDSAGRGQRIVQPARDRVMPGVAYWVGCARAPKSLAALNVRSPADGVDFGSLLTERKLYLKNLHPTSPLMLTLRLKESEPPPDSGKYPRLAGPVPLSVLGKNASDDWTWTFFPSNGLLQALEPGKEAIVSLGLRRQDMATTPPQGSESIAYQSILEITDSTESLLLHLPVVACPESVANLSLEEHNEKEGLWVGQVVIDQVNAPAYATTLLPAPSPLSFRLLVHVDGTGQARLLQEAILAWDKSLTEAPHTNGTYALYTAASSLPADATDVKRISSVAFPVMSPVSLGSISDPVLAATVTVSCDDPTNPFLHRYHPSHDNRDAHFSSYTNAVETPTISRTVHLQLTSSTNTPANPYWGVQAIAGTYEETLLGLRAQVHGQDLKLKGSFILERISRINSLK